MGWVYGRETWRTLKMSSLAPGLAWLARSWATGFWLLRLPANLSSIKKDVLAAGRLEVENPIVSRCLFPFTRARFLSFLAPGTPYFLILLHPRVKITIFEQSISNGFSPCYTPSRTIDAR
jgi:hypothetical protein